jgi:GT2 family glycosyltransferase
MYTELFTITIPVFNRYEFFEEAIASALNQSVRCSVIVVDNNSDHNKFEEYVTQLNDPLVTYHRNEKNLGMVGNWNRCIELANTPWVSILHDDDALHPDFIKSILRVIKYNPDAGLIAGKVKVGYQQPESFKYYAKKNPRFKFIKNTFFLYRNLSPFPGVAFKRALVEKAGFFDPSLHPVADLYFWYRLTCISKTAIIEDLLAFYRISSTQESFSNVKKLVEATQVFKENVIQENNVTDWVSRLSVLWAKQQYIDYYNRVYPNSKVANLKYGKLLSNSSFSRVMNHIRDAKSFM